MHVCDGLTALGLLPQGLTERRGGREGVVYCMVSGATGELDGWVNRFRGRAVERVDREDGWERGMSVRGVLPTAVGWVACEELGHR